jgi:GNAT superfamily N-acetyltransferase
MIRQCTARDLPALYEIINEAAQTYQGVIPDDCWHEPYMPIEELRRAAEEGIAFFVYVEQDTLLGVMGIQHVQDVTLIRHAYVRPAYQGQGIGSKLLAYLVSLTERPILIGTWADATWAIRFYEKHGFRLVPRQQIAPLLERYWSISARQVETSVVLADRAWHEQGLGT